MKNRSSCRARVRGFTLIEIIVVVGIIALLAALIVPAVLTAQRKATRTKAAAELIAIGTALDAYKADFGDIPRMGAIVRGPDIGKTEHSIGFAVLGKALFSPGPADARATGLAPVGAGPYLAGTVASTGSGASYREFVAFGAPDALLGNAAALAPASAGWLDFPVSDGANGPGFRVRPGGKVYPAYLQADKFKLRGLAVLDSWGNPILYFAARPGNTSQTPPWNLLVYNPPLAPPPPKIPTVYEAVDNISFFERPGDTVPANAVKRMDALMVRDSTNFDGIVQLGESAVATKEFLLWSAGPDGKYGVDYTGADPTKKEIEKNDDIANFRTE